VRTAPIAGRRVWLCCSAADAQQRSALCSTVCLATVSRQQSDKRPCVAARPSPNATQGLLHLVAYASLHSHANYPEPTSNIVAGQINNGEVSNAVSQCTAALSLLQLQASREYALPEGRAARAGASHRCLAASASLPCGAAFAAFSRPRDALPAPRMDVKQRIAWAALRPPLCCPPQCSSQIPLLQPRACNPSPRRLPHASPP
jgi:hypothetical protein